MGQRAMEQKMVNKACNLNITPAIIEKPVGEYFYDTSYLYEF